MEQVYKAVTQSIFLFVSLVSICDEYVVVVFLNRSLNFSKTGK